MLIQLIKKNTSQNRLLNNVKAKECIIKSFALSNIENPNIDFVIETLFYTYSRDKNENVRKAALLSLDILHKRSKELQIEQATYQTGMYDQMEDSQRSMA